jgi:FtsH-binding integral membrane protein
VPTAAIQNGRPAADCPPAPVRVTKSLLGYGVIAGPFYVVASLAEALTRAGFSLADDDWSLLANGTLGWIHVLVLVLAGLMVAAAAVGVTRQLRAERQNAASGWLLGVYAAGLVGAGFFVADPADGFPVGTPPGPAATPSWHATLHIVFGGVGFLGLITACLVLAWQFRGLRQLGWAIFSLATGVLFFAAFAGIATARTPGSAGVLAFTGAVILAWTWLALVSAHLYRRASTVAP